MSYKKVTAFRYRRAVIVGLALSLGCLLAAACSEQGDEANKFVGEMNELAVKAEALARIGATKQDEIESTDVEKERDVIKELGREQAVLYKQGAESFRAAASKADEAAKLRLPDWFKTYLSLKSQQHRKRAEILDVAVARADVFAGDAELEELDLKVSQLNERIAMLSKEEEELTKQAAQIEAEHKAEFNQ